MLVLSCSRCGIVDLDPGSIVVAAHPDRIWLRSRCPRCAYPIRVPCSAANAADYVRRGCPAHIAEHLVAHSAPGQDHPLNEVEALLFTCNLADDEAFADAVHRLSAE